MRKPKIQTFKEHLKEELKDPEFRKYFEEERQALDLAIKIARLRKKRVKPAEFSRVNEYKSASHFKT